MTYISLFYYFYIYYLYLSYNIKQCKSIPVVKGDEVVVKRGSHKGATGKITQVYRKKYVIHIENLVRKNAREQQVPLGINTSNVQVTKLNLKKDRKDLLARKDRTRYQNKGKFTESDVKNVD